jgi:MFS transporter, NNP family, nitrate/nitrite transporter
MDAPMEHRSAAGASRVLLLSTTAFTSMFAVWLMFGVIGIPIQKEFGLSDVQFSWLGAIAVLNGSIWRLWFGIFADRIGGRRIFTALLLMSALSSLAIVMAKTFEGLLLCAFLVGIAGNSFAAGIAWNAAWFPRSRQGVALGTFGAGNVGASVTKLFGPALITAVPAAGLAGGWIPGGWRVVPVAYAVLLTMLAACIWWLAPLDPRASGARCRCSVRCAR